MAKAPNCAAARSQSPPSAIRATLSSSGKSARARPRPVSAMSGDREAARHITRTWLAWDIDALARKVIIVVETELAIHPDDKVQHTITLDMPRLKSIALSLAVPRPLATTQLVPHPT